MKERPVLFSAPMVRALLADTKTQTRRVVKPQPELVPEDKLHGRAPGSYWWPCNAVQSMIDVEEMGVWASPYGHPGERLWVREAWSLPVGLDSLSPSKVAEKCLEAGYASPWSPIRFAADGYEHGQDMLRDFGGAWGKPRSSLHMPRWASRIDLSVTDVRVERLRAITEADCIAEGCAVTDPSPHSCARDVFASLWTEINGAESWASNPWVWVVSFKRVIRAS